MNKIMGILLLLIYVCTAAALLSDRFAQPYNMQNIIRYSALYGIIGIGVSMVIITGGIDLSIGSLIGLTGCVLPMLLVDEGWPAPLAVLAVLILAGLLGLGHGLLITKLKLQPFIVTLCGLLIYRGVARWITKDWTKGFGSDWDSSLRLLANGRPCSVATLILLAGVVVLLGAIWRQWSQRSQVPLPHSRALAAAIVVMGLSLVIVGSSRFWQGAEFFFSGGLDKWHVAIPPGQELEPQRWMSRSLPLALVSLAWLLAVCVSRAPVAMLPPLGLSTLGALLVVMTRVPPGQVASNREMAALLLSLGCLVAGLGWLCRRSLAIGGRAAQAPLSLAGFFASLWLLGQVRLAETLVQTPFLFLLAIALLAGVFLNQTIYGRYLLALGNNEEAARYSGINTDRMIILAYVLCALATGVGGILFALDVNSVQPATFGVPLELYAIAAAVLGGCSLRGGEGNIIGVIIGAAVMRALYNAINILGIPSQLELAIIGVVILCGVLADELVKRLASRKSGEDPAMN